MFSRTVSLFLDFRKIFSRVIYLRFKKEKLFKPANLRKNSESKTANKDKKRQNKAKPSFYRFCTTDMSNICFIYRFSLLLFTIQESAFYFVCSVVIWYVF